MWSNVKALLHEAQARYHPDLLAAIVSTLTARHLTGCPRLNPSLRQLFHLKCKKNDE
jgi:hypothetical protein